MGAGSNDNITQLADHVKSYSHKHGRSNCSVQEVANRLRAPRLSCMSSVRFRAQ